MANELVNRLEDRIRMYEVYGTNGKQERNDLNLLRDAKHELMRLRQVEINYGWEKNPDRMGQ